MDTADVSTDTILRKRKTIDTTCKEVRCLQLGVKSLVLLTNDAAVTQREQQPKRSSCGKQRRAGIRGEPNDSDPLGRWTHCSLEDMPVPLLSRNLEEYRRFSRLGDFTSSGKKKTMSKTRYASPRIVSFQPPQVVEMPVPWSFWVWYARPSQDGEEYLFFVK